MSAPYLSEIRIMAFGFPPKSWAQCNGQTLPINQNQALFSLLLTNFGGNGTTTFQLPNLQGRVPIHMGTSLANESYDIGAVGGETTHALIRPEMPTHDHAMWVKQGPADTGQGAPGIYPAPSKCLAEGLAAQGTEPPVAMKLYGSGAPELTFSPLALGVTGGGGSHENRQPYLAVNFCIALLGIYPEHG